MNFGDYDFSLPANGSMTIPATGSVVRVRASSGPVRISINGASGVKLVAGQGFELKGAQFTRLTITDISGAPNAGVVFAGDAGYTDQTFSGAVSLVAGQQIAVNNFPQSAQQLSAQQLAQANRVFTHTANSTTAVSTYQAGVLLYNQAGTAQMALKKLSVVTSAVASLQLYTSLVSWSGVAPVGQPGYCTGPNKATPSSGAVAQIFSTANVTVNAWLTPNGFPSAQQASPSRALNLVPQTAFEIQFDNAWVLAAQQGILLTLMVNGSPTAYYATWEWSE